MKTLWRAIIFRVVTTVCSALHAQSLPADSPGFRVPPGFRVTLFADEKLANDIFAMTLDARGRVVVTGPGYIRRLEDSRGTGKADKAILYGTTRTGGMGLCFDGSDLLFFGDGGLWRYRDADGDGVADGPPEKIMPFGNSEHGGHAIRRGPDGSWYLIGGNDAGFQSVNTANVNSPIRDCEGGALLRFPPDFKNVETIAHGFRNPYDFDFNARGDIFTCDSDVESDVSLPWYTPVRLYQIAYGGHHGWRLGGWKRGWNRLDYYPDTVSILSKLGRGSPTGVLIYRHHQFPAHYRDGLFALDWTFGKIYFFPLQAAASGYQTATEVFLEPIGTQGFAPTDCAVGPDGALYVCTGGRKTRGAVYRIAFTGPPLLKNTSPGQTPLGEILTAEQPLDEWSRNVWVPAARKLGPAPFLAAAQNAALPVEQRIRAIEISTELFGGMTLATARNALIAAPPVIRARLAWSIGRAPFAGFAEVLTPLAADADPVARRCALESLADHAPEFNPGPLLTSLPACLADPDKRVRIAATRLARLLPEKEWQTLWPASGSGNGNRQGQLSLALAAIERNPTEATREQAAVLAVSILEKNPVAELQLQAVRILILALGDYNLNSPTIEAWTAYQSPPGMALNGALVARISRAARPLFPSTVRELNLEVTRLLAMTGDEDINLVVRLLNSFTAVSDPTNDFHYLAVLSRLPVARDLPSFVGFPGRSRVVAGAILNLDRKLGKDLQSPRQNWNQRRAEITSELMRRDPGLAPELINHPDFPRPGNVSLAAAFDAAHRQQAARVFFRALQRDTSFPWTGPLIQLLAVLPAGEVRPVLRGQWGNRALREDIISVLAEPAEETDRGRFLEELGTGQIQTFEKCLRALTVLPRDPAPADLVPLLQKLRRLCAEAQPGKARAQLAALVAHEAGRDFSVRETGTTAETLRKDYQPLYDWFAQKYPALARTIASDPEEEILSKAILKVNWTSGVAARGALVFRERGCESCHVGANPLGPSLAGVAVRLSREDLFAAILFPNRDIAPQYQTTKFEMKDGSSFSGMISYESGEAVILQTGANATIRLASAEIIGRQPGTVSLMPSGLMAGLSSGDLADLYAYVKTLTAAK